MFSFAHSGKNIITFVCRGKFRLRIEKENVLLKPHNGFGGYHDSSDLRTHYVLSTCASQIDLSSIPATNDAEERDYGSVRHIAHCGVKQQILSC